MNTEFGAYRLSGRERQLWGPQGVLEISARSYDLLSVLLNSPGQIVLKDQLLAAAWPGLIVEENTLQVHISALRKALEPGMILTVHGRGYKYVGPEPVTSDPDVTRQIPATAGRANADQTTSVAVLPFRNLSDDPKQDSFAEGLAEDITTELARHRNLAVIAQGLMARYKNRTVDLSEISAELDVDFILVGSVRMSGKALRVAVQLVDAQNGAQVWGDRYDREMVDVFQAQDDVVSDVIGRLTYSLEEVAGKKRQANPASSNSPYSYLLKSRVAWRSGDLKAALDNGLKTVELDPGYARAQAYLAFLYSWNLFIQWIDISVAESTRLAKQAIERALALDRVDPFVLHRASITHLMIGEPLIALRYAKAAAAESPRDLDILHVHGTALSYCGHHDQGVALLERAVALEQRLSTTAVSTLAECLFNQRNYARSLEVLERTPNPPSYYMVQKAGCLARLGRLNEARHLIGTAPQGYDVVQCITCLAAVCALPDDAEHWLESYRMLGVNV